MLKPGNESPMTISTWLMWLCEASSAQSRD